MKPFYCIVFKYSKFRCLSFSSAQPTFDESGYRGNIVDKSDSQHTRLATGEADFAPRYPTYNPATLPPLPNH